MTELGERRPSDHSPDAAEVVFAHAPDVRSTDCEAEATLRRERPGQADVVDDAVADGLEAAGALERLASHEHAPACGGRPAVHAPHGVEQVEEVDEGRDEQLLD